MSAEFSATVLYCDLNSIDLNCTKRQVVLVDSNRIVQIEFSCNVRWLASQTVQSVAINWKNYNIYSVSLFDQPVTSLTETEPGVYTEMTMRMPSKLDFHVSTPPQHNAAIVTSLVLQINESDFTRTLAQSRLHQQEK
jgi:hypothetical protein